METRFEFRDFIKVFALAIGLYTLFALFLIRLPSADLLSAVHPSLIFLLTYLIQFVIFFFPLWIFVVGKYSATKEDFGLVEIKPVLLVKTVLWAYGIYLLFVLLANILLTSLGWSLPGFEAQDSYLSFFGNDFLGISIALLTVSFIAPFIEEILFRGFIYRIFIKIWPLWLGSLLSAGLFALIHFQPQSFIPLFLLGVLLNATYQKTGSLWTPIVFHSINNLLAFAVQIYVSYNSTMF